MIWLSIIIPVYNGATRIEKCLKSLFRQTTHDFEVIIIDDGSTDKSYHVIEQVLRQKPEWFQVTLRQHGNQGVAYTRNLGISLANGMYVTFIDQDDYVDSEYCSAYIEQVREKPYDIVVGGYERVTDTRVIRREVLIGKEWDPFFVVSPWAHIYKKDFLTSNRITFLSTNIGEDIYFNLVAYSYTRHIKTCVNNCGYKWYYNEKSVSNSRQRVVCKENNPLYMLRLVHKDFAEENCIDYNLRSYFFTRYIVWYLLFAVRKSKRRNIVKAVDELYGWLEKEYPDYRKCTYLKRMPQGESKKVYLSVRILLLLKKIHLDKLFLCVAAKI